MRTCTKCGVEKPINFFHKDKSKKSGYRSHCVQCTTNWKTAWRRRSKGGENYVEYRIRVMAEKLLQRVNYSRMPKYKKRLASYHRNSVESRIGSTVEEVMNTLRDNFHDDIKSMLDVGETPTVDRIESTGHYELNNIRIASHYQNSVDGFRSANKERMKAVYIVYKSGEKINFDSIKEASRQLGVDPRVIRRSIALNEPSKKHGFKAVLV